MRNDNKNVENQWQCPVVFIEIIGGYMKTMMNSENCNFPIERAYSLYTYQNYRVEKTCLQSTMYNLKTQNFCKGPVWNKQIILYWTADIFVDTLLLEQCLASYHTTFKDMHRSLKRKAPSDDAFPNLFAKNDDEIIRSHTDLIEALFEAFPDIDFKQLYRYVKGVGIFKCNETTHNWEEILNCEFEYTLSKLAKAHVPNLNTRELKNVGQFNQLLQLPRFLSIHNRPLFYGYSRQQFESICLAKWSTRFFDKRIPTSLLGRLRFNFLRLGVFV
ncbi:hypothetical protein CEXT_376531 [Caerostris extrusa]|uniref:Uncharacterized protein n=1 Tax=Caerostris extrusa TaxID=172846 RepID=A0AAV4MFI7_CAEEX|nr:hypothetical protein CEXT_376531 [Caerostris extrusa]